MYFQHIYDKSLAQASYFIGCQKAGVAAVIDPKRDVDSYLEIAKQNNVKITHILETHIHADFLSGSRELAAITGAQIYLSAEGGPEWKYEFPHNDIKDGDVLKLGNLKIEVVHTPGHTPESVSFLLTDTPASHEPVMLFTGDFVFVGDVGRPDLLEKAAGMKGTQDVGAKEMYQSIKKFDALPDYIQVWPGHGAGSACGKALGAVPSTTVGYEKIRNWAFQYKNNEKGFTDYLLADQPEPPKYFAMMKKLNKVDRPLLVEVPKHAKLSKAEFLDAYEKGMTIIDTRNKADFANGFIPDTINIQGNNSFATWCGWMLDYEEQFILIADESQMEDLTRKLMRIGLDNIYGYIDNVEEMGFELQKSDVISIDEFKNHIGKTNVQIIDVRGEAEYNADHIEGAINLFTGTLKDNLNRIDTKKEVVIHCQSGDRAAIAASLLRKKGIKVKNYSAGMAEWKKYNNLTVSN